MTDVWANRKSTPLQDIKAYMEIEKQRDNTFFSNSPIAYGRELAKYYSKRDGIEYEFDEKQFLKDSYTGKIIYSFKRSKKDAI